jgi:hypothetical protein
VAGLVVPLALLAFIALAIAHALQTRSAFLLGYFQNIVLFLVGWHYVKQGYGILIVDSVQKKLPLSGSVKTALRINAYACWLLAWVGANTVYAQMGPAWGIPYTSLPLPKETYPLVAAIAAVSTVALLGMLYQVWRQRRTLPWNGLIAYLTTLYVWLLFARTNPLVYLIVPTFHSLQYLTVVWRYQINAGAGRAQRNKGVLSTLARVLPDNTWWRLALFVGLGTLLGQLFFNDIPLALDSYFDYDKSIFGSNLFLFSFWMFINAHHYFLDNVMWRRGNPDVQQFIFTR